MRYCGYHTHTTFSDGKHSMEEMVRAAIRLGMPAIGFSDHSFTPCDPSYCMHTEQYPAYLAEMDRLREKYGDQITIMKGLELDYDSDMAITEALDYYLGSVHYLTFDGRVYAIDHPGGPRGPHAADIQRACIQQEFGGDALAFCRCYYDTLVEHVHRCKPTIVGHFDLITKFGLFDEEDPAYQAIALEALERVVEVTPVVEVNTGAISRGWRERPYPAPFLLRRLRELDGQVILGADAHAADAIDCYFPQAVELIKAVGFDYLLTLWPDGFHKEML